MRIWLSISVANAYTPLTINSKLLDSSRIPFTGQKNYLQQTLDFSVLEPFLVQINDTYGKPPSLPLKSRGEAHITVITPPEFTSLSPQLTISDINRIALSNNIQSSPFTIICLARQVPAGKEELGFVYNLLIDNPSLVSIRKQIYNEYLMHKGNPNAFDASKFYPHITIAFETTDFFESEGVIKNPTTCIQSVTFQ
jgi:hypothetical protein